MQCLEIPHLKLDMVANSGQCFRMKALDADTYRVLVGKKQVDITPLGDDRFQLSCEESETDGWRRYFDMETDYGPLLTRAPCGRRFPAPGRVLLRWPAHSASGALRDTHQLHLLPAKKHPRYSGLCGATV